MTTIMNSNNIVSSSMIFCGLVSGYQGEGNTATPENAAAAVRAALAARGSLEPEVRPAVCVYHTDWGCPIGGEPVGAYSANGTPEKILTEAEMLRKDLKQSTLSVALPGHGAPTLGFTAEVINGDCCAVGASWQQIAGRLFAEQGTYVSCGIVQYLGCCIISAEANPAFVQDLESWKQIVSAICAELGTETPEFYEVGFNYLKDAE